MASACSISHILEGLGRCEMFVGLSTTSGTWHSCYDPVPMPPIWVNEDGQRAQTRPYPRPGCGREVPIRRYSHQTLRLIGWPLYRVASVVQWCGHRLEFIPVPDERQWVRMVPIIGTAT